jgi:ATP-dependent protease ClpP protease subunit
MSRLKAKQYTSNSDNYEEGLGNPQPAYQQVTTTYHTNEHWFYLSTPILEPGLYTDMIHTIRTASIEDVIYVCLNTPGGRLDTGIQILNAMRSSQAVIITVLEAEASSMGSILFLAADQHIVHDNCRMMFHDFSGGAGGGKGNEQFKELTNTLQLYNKLLKSICVPFLTNDEVDGIIEGKDYWMDSDEIRERLKQINENSIIEESVIEASNKKAKKNKESVQQ